MELERLTLELSVCKLKSAAEAGLCGGFFFLGKTDREVSLVCPAGEVPPGAIAREDGWRAFRVRGTLDFSLIGVLARLSVILAENGIGIFVVSTFDTDYILVRDEDFDRAALALEKGGYAVA